MIQDESKSRFSTRLRIKLQLARQGLSTAKSLPGRKPDWRGRYKEYLFTLHSIIRSSVPLLQAAERACLELDKDKLSPLLAKYYHEHSTEEEGHDRWLLADLEVMGVRQAEVLSRRPIDAVSELVGSQYYWIHHMHPLYLLGYIAVLEGYPPRASDLERLRVRTGYPKAAFRTLLKHSSLDSHHRDDLNSMLDSLPLTEKDEEWITLNAIHTVRKWKEILSVIYTVG